MSTSTQPEIRSLHETSPGLSWDPTGTSKSQFELRNNQNELHALMWKVGAKGNSCIGRVAEGKWTFKRTGFLGRTIQVFVEDTENVAGTFHFKGIFGKGVFTHSNGREYQWSRANVAGEEWNWTDGEDNVLLNFRQLRKVWTENCAMSVPREAQIHSALPLLTLLGWFLILVMARNEHTTRDDGRQYYEDKY